MKLATPIRLLLLLLLLLASAACAPHTVEMATAPEPGVVPAAEAPPSDMARDAQQLAAMEAMLDDQRFEAEELEPEGSMGTELVLAEISKEIAAKIVAELSAKGKEFLFARLAVTDSVPLADFKRQSEFGRLLAEYILTDLAEQGLQVSELRLGKEIVILPQTGEFIMSRNVGELLHAKPEFDYVVVGTFSNTRSTLIIQGRLVEASQGVVETSWRYTLPLNREVAGLFFDPEAASPAPEAPFTMAVKGVGQ